MRVSLLMLNILAFRNLRGLPENLAIPLTFVISIVSGSIIFQRRGDIRYYRTLSPEEKKGINTLVYGFIASTTILVMLIIKKMS